MVDFFNRLACIAFITKLGISILAIRTVVVATDCQRDRNRHELSAEAAREVVSE